MAFAAQHKKNDFVCKRCMSTVLNNKKEHILVSTTKGSRTACTCMELVRFDAFKKVMNHCT